MKSDRGRLCRGMAAVLLVLLLAGTLVGFVFATKKDVLMALVILIGGSAFAYGAHRILHVLAEAGERGNTGTETKEEKKARKLNKLLDDLYDN